MSTYQRIYDILFRELFSILALLSFKQNFPLNWFPVSFNLCFCSVLVQCIVVVRLFCLLVSVVAVGFYHIYYYFWFAIFQIELFVLLLVLIS